MIYSNGFVWKLLSNDDNDWSVDGNVRFIVTVVILCLGKFLWISSVRWFISSSLFVVRVKCLRIVRNVFDNTGFVDLSSWKPPINVGSNSIDPPERYICVYWLNGCKWVFEKFSSRLLKENTFDNVPELGAIDRC